jgi:hypothetical protein
MRRGLDWSVIGVMSRIPREIVNAADYSYQAWGYEANGWVSEERRKRFYAILYRVLTESEDIPF